MYDSSTNLIHFLQNLPCPCGFCSLLCMTGSLCVLRGQVLSLVLTGAPAGGKEHDTQQIRFDKKKGFSSIIPNYILNIRPYKHREA